ncbi:hypothetical protein ABT075_45205, partial [Streptomyces sp. NPDC002677]|uniref:hypothetical protein n=1 Tax=Streptomyces sp. NPDC002677 TaxID=3154774 RepID=UPI00332710F3
MAGATTTTLRDLGFALGNAGSACTANLSGATGTDLPAGRLAGGGRRAAGGGRRAAGGGRRAAGGGRRAAGGWRQLGGAWGR